MSRKEELMKKIKNTEDVVNKLELQIDVAKQSIKEMKQELENIEDVDWLQDGVMYWFIDTDGDIFQTTFNVNCKSDQYRKSVGNYYKTKALAERKRNKIKSDWVLQKLIKIQNYVDNLEEDWEAGFSNQEQKKYYVYYDHFNKKWDWGYMYNDKSNEVYMSESTAKRVVEMLQRGEL